MFTLKEVAEKLRVSYLTVYKAVQDGRIKAVKIGRDYRVTEEEVERIKKEGTG